MSNSAFERAKSNLSIFAKKSISLEKQTPEPFKSHQNLPIDSNEGGMHFELWPQFSDFAQFLCAFVLKPHLQ